MYYYNRILGHSISAQLDLFVDLETSHTCTLDSHRFFPVNIRWLLKSNLTQCSVSIIIRWEQWKLVALFYLYNFTLKVSAGLKIYYEHAKVLNYTSRRTLTVCIIYIFYWPSRKTLTKYYCYIPQGYITRHEL